MKIVAYKRKETNPEQIGSVAIAGDELEFEGNRNFRRMIERLREENRQIPLEDFLRDLPVMIKSSYLYLEIEQSD